MRDDRLGPFRLTRLIRASQIHEIWEAFEEDQHESNALKVLRPRYRSDASKIASLRHEHEVALSLGRNARLNRVYDFRIEGGTPFLVLELFSPLNMKLLLQHGSELLNSVLDQVVQQAAEGLEHLHAYGWLHHDVTPGHFLIDREGETKLIDFAEAEEKPGRLASLFRRPRVVGSRGYMSPEMIRARRCDERSDIYSFGCTLFEAVTGAPPFVADSPAGLMAKHLYEPIPDPSLVNERISPEFADLIMRMLAKEPKYRPASMAAFCEQSRQIRIFQNQA